VRLSAAGQLTRNGDGTSRVLLRVRVIPHWPYWGGVFPDLRLAAREQLTRNRDGASWVLLQVHAQARFTLDRCRVSPEVRFSAAHFTRKGHSVPKLLVAVRANARFARWRSGVSADGVRHFAGC